MPEQKKNTVDQTDRENQHTPEGHEPTQTAHGDQAGEQGAPGNNDSEEGGNGHQSDVTPD